MRYSDRSGELDCYVCGKAISVGVDYGVPEGLEVRHADGTEVCEEVRWEGYYKPEAFKPLRHSLPEEARMNELEAKLRLEIDPAQPGVSRRMPFPVGLVLLGLLFIAAMAGVVVLVTDRWP